MKLSKHALTVLNAQYRSVLKKCLLVNAGLLFCATGAMASTTTLTPTGGNAIEVTEGTSVINGDWSGWLIGSDGKSYSTGTTYTVPLVSVENSSLELDKTRIVVVKDGKNGSLNFNNAGLKLQDSEIDVSDEDDYEGSANFTNSEVTLTNSSMQINGATTFKDSQFNLIYDENAKDIKEQSNEVEVYDLTLNKTKVTVSDARTQDTTLSAKHELNILNGSDVTLENNAVLAWNGQVYEEDENGKDVCVGVDGKVNIQDSFLTLKGNAKLSIGMDDDEGADKNQAKLNIANSEITLKDQSSVEFYDFNKGNTKIENSTINMNGESSMKLNDLSMDKSYIVLTGAAKNDKGEERLNIKDVQLKNSFILGLNNVIRFAGNVDFSGLFDPATAEVDGSLTRGGYDDEITYNINSGTLKYTEDKFLYEKGLHTHDINETRTTTEKVDTVNGVDILRNTFADGKYALNSINFNGGTLDLANGEASAIKLAKIGLSKVSNINVDVDLANETMDTIEANEVSGNAKLNIAKLNLVSDAKDEVTTINFTEDEKLLASVDYTGEKSGLKALSPIYTYDVEYDKELGDFTFTRGEGNNVEDYNEAVYADSVVGQAVAMVQSNIATTVFSSLVNNMSASAPVSGMASGDKPRKENAWVSVNGYDEDIDLKSFNSVDTNTYSVTAGVNSETSCLCSNKASYGIYAGYLNGEQKYSGNKTEQQGGYAGLSAFVTNGKAELLGTVNGGYIRNENKNTFGNDKFDTYFTGVALKAGYNYSLAKTVSVQPNLYAGYTFVNTEDYTSKSGAKMESDNLHLFEVAPGVKVNKNFNNGWSGYAQAKYAFIFDKGGDATVNDIALPNVSAKNYVEYGLGAIKNLNDDWSMSAEINRRDGGREGWNGNLNLKYNF